MIQVESVKRVEVHHAVARHRWMDDVRRLWRPLETKALQAIVQVGEFIMNSYDCNDAVIVDPSHFGVSVPRSLESIVLCVGKT
jgi:hypothetical protein